jgi:hypothetical protein
VYCPVIALPAKFEAPLKEAVPAPGKVSVKLIWFPLIVPATLPDMKHGESASAIVPFSVLPVWDKFAVIEPLRPKVELHVPCQEPDRLMPWLDGVTLKFRAFDVPPPGDGLATMTGKLPVTERSDTLSEMESRPLLKNEGTWGIPLNVTDEDGMNPLPLIVSVTGELTPAGDEVGDKPVMAGWGFGEVVVTAKLSGCELPPPGGGFVTITANVPVVARSEPVSVIVIWLILTNEGV